MGNQATVIHVFVSSPGDVKEERKALEEVVARINKAGGVPLKLFRWESDVPPMLGPGPQPVVDAHTPPDYSIYLGIMKHRFGTSTGDYDSGTEKEFNDALTRWGKTGKPRILFYFSSEKVDPAKLDLKQYTKVQRFRKKLEKKGIIATYTVVRGEKEGFFEQVELHLRDVLARLAPGEPGKPGRPVPLPASPDKYLRELRDETAHIDIRGLEVGTGKAHRFPIADLYMTLTTTRTEWGDDGAKKGRGRRGEKGEAPGDGLMENRSVPLHEALREKRMVVIGDPGAGKTTFLRRVVHTLCQAEPGTVPGAAERLPGIPDATFPILVRLNELDDFIISHKKTPGAPTSDGEAAWLPRFLAAKSRDRKWGLDEDFFRAKLESGQCAVLMDGLDEASDRAARKRLVKLVEDVARVHEGCRLVVTSRPGGYTDDARVSGFAHARIDPLSGEAVETFLTRWCGLIYTDAPQACREHCEDLLGALRARPDIRRMARNPVMLTALAVVHWNERRLPEQRADLYESIIKWLSRSREQRPGRESAKRTVDLLQEVALAMQGHPKGMRTQVSRRWAAESIAGEWEWGREDKRSIRKATEFLEAEELDSGIIVSRGNGLAFWHRSFQEYLAARAIAALPEAGQRVLLWSEPVKVYLPEWREVMLLLAGILLEQGRAKMDDLAGSMLERAESIGTLTEKARCVGLLGSMLRDLKPIGYELRDERYEQLSRDVYAIFDREASQTVPVEARIEAADALGQSGDWRLDTSHPDYWVTIEGGEFWMGAQSRSPGGPNYDPEAYKDESPVHEVYLESFKIGRYPVTVGEYRRFVEDDGYKEEKYWGKGGFGEFQEPKDWAEQVPFPSRPVVGVGWYEAVAYCEWANVRLLTEAEWERAAWGREGRKYPWGDEAPDTERLNYAKNVGHPTPVGIYPLGQTPEGVCDMAGNVWEWCADWYDEYSPGRVENPVGPEKGRDRVFRGGAWSLLARDCRATWRFGYGPEARLHYLGFRVSPIPARRGSRQMGSNEAWNAGRGGGEAERAPSCRSGRRSGRKVTPHTGHGKSE